MIIMAIVDKHINLYKATSNRTEQAILCNTTNEWNEIGARYVYAQNTPNIYYGGSTGVSDNRELARTDYGFLKRIKDGEAHRLLKLSDYIPSRIVTNTSFGYFIGSRWMQGLFVAGGPFIVSSPKMVNVRTIANVRLQASTAPGWCWSCFGWKFTSINFLDGRVPEQYVAFDGGKGDGVFSSDVPGHSWTNSQNLPAGSGPGNGFSGVLFNHHSITGSNDIRQIFNETTRALLPAGKSYLCLYWTAQASGGDSAGFGYYGGDISIWV